MAASPSPLGIRSPEKRVPRFEIEESDVLSRSRKFRRSRDRNPEAAFDCPEHPSQPPEPEEPADAVADFPLKSKGFVVQQR